MGLRDVFLSLGSTPQGRVESELGQGSLLEWGLTCSQVQLTTSAQPKRERSGPGGLVAGKARGFPGLSDSDSGDSPSLLRPGFMQRRELGGSGWLTENSTQTDFSN